MICQGCGQSEGTIHVLEVIAGQPRSIWLCGVCAAARQDLPLAGLTPAGTAAALGGLGEPASLASFLGQTLAEGEEGLQMSPCPGCGYELKAFRETNRLGCPQCYEHFRARILPILARYHRHASHVGKVPRQAGGLANQQGEVTRLRVALEKNIRGENYEEAARLRDRIRELGAGGAVLPAPDDGEASG